MHQGYGRARLGRILGNDAQLPDKTNQTDALLRQLADGNRGALDQLWVLHGGAIHGIGMRFLGTADAGEDVLQEAFVKIWQNAHRFDPNRGTGTAWIFTIVRNVARDHLRRQRLRWLVGLDALVTEPVDTAPDQTVQADDRAKLRQVQAEMLDLPDRQRMALLLSATAGLDTHEIATIMGSSQGAVEQLIVRARRHLRARMKETGHE
ncbi:RNA polymerase sigma factor [Cognatiyoonia sp. IB215182]|uniref:RNA polymerase sigma factor n=1 Tax=Cognatiyoonia sp. IB215182 TaxID=3097353 RepID=UPI002A0E604F|nr:RNA polymerase sigma factor [Cognatiyoonia sp. IB215182]MDX8352377.1 RNA polymerase sigma factor [Cognatiyoonia sp. IB215182]